MKPWASWDVWRRLTGLTADHTSTSTVLAIRVAETLQLLAEAAVSTGLDDPMEPVLAAVDLAADAHPTAATVANLRNLVYGWDGDIEGLVALCAEEADRLGSAAARIAQHGAPLINAGASVLVHSLSSSVRAVLDQARLSTHFSVACTADDEHGPRMSYELQDAGYLVETLTVREASTFVEGFDVVIVGADAVGPGRIINRMGTGVIAKACLDASIGCYVIAGSDKILPEEFFAGVADRSGFMEFIPLSWFRGVVTEDGLLEPGDVSRMATERPVAARLR